MRSRPEYADQMEALQHTVYGTSREHFLGDAILAEQFRFHTKVFPQGQYIAVDTDRDLVVGLTVSMCLQFDPKHPHTLMENWRETTNNAWLTTHKPDGNWMYGVESSVHPDYQGYGIGRALMEARRHVIRKLNLRGMVAGGTLKDYHRHHRTMSPQEYVAHVERGELFDTNISKQIRMGFKPIAVVPNYVDDPDTLGYAALIVWHNPDYHPERLPQRVRTPRVALALQHRKVSPHLHHGQTHHSDTAGAGV
ncbi:MAG: GNAT family N-acetyltransferase [Chloroflexota bacterium]|nr:GNAT family N-acetyltransferase [Chloroflexota bacterium]